LIKRFEVLFNQKIELEKEEVYKWLNLASIKDMDD
jgi:hypothetical protein